MERTLTLLKEAMAVKNIIVGAKKEAPDAFKTERIDLCHATIALMARDSNGYWHKSSINYQQFSELEWIGECGGKKQLIYSLEEMELIAKMAEMLLGEKLQIKEENSSYVAIYI